MGCLLNEFLFFTKIYKFSLILLFCVIILIDIRTKIEARFLHVLYAYKEDELPELSQRFRKEAKEENGKPAKKRREKELVRNDIIDRLSWQHTKDPFYFIGDDRGYWVYKHNHKLYGDVSLSLRWIIRKYFSLWKLRPTKKELDDMISEIKDYRKLSLGQIDREETFDYINYQNGHYRITDGKLITRRDEESLLFDNFYESTQIPFRYNKDAKEPTPFLDMLKLAATNQEDPKAWIEDIQEIFGYCFTKKINYRLMFMFIDFVQGVKKKKGNNLKSTILDCLAACLGDDNYKKASLHKLLTVRFAKGGIAHHQVVSNPDLNQDELKNIGDLKDWVSERFWEYEVKFGKPNVQILNIHKFINSMQNIPYINYDSLDISLTKRIKFMLFKYSLPPDKVDLDWFNREIRDNTEVIEGIIKWSMEGLKRLTERGHFLRCDGEENLHFWRNEIDKLYKFYHECCIVRKSGRSVANLHDIRLVFDKWLEYNNSELKLTAQQFNQRIISMDVDFSINKSGSYNRINGLDLDWKNEWVCELARDAGLTHKVHNGVDLVRISNEMIKKEN